MFFPFLVGMLMLTQATPQTGYAFPQWSGMVCDKASAETVVDRYQAADEDTVQAMITQTHQCADVAVNRPLYIVYCGKWVWGPAGLMRVIGMSLTPTMPALMYGFMKPNGPPV